MENVIKFIQEWGYTILFVVYVIGTCIKMGKQWTEKKAYSLMLVAKQQAKEDILNNGQEQEEFVVDALYLILSRLKIPFITKDKLKPYVHMLYLKAMDLIDDGKVNKSVG